MIPAQSTPDVIYHWYSVRAECDYAAMGIPDFTVDFAAYENYMRTIHRALSEPFDGLDAVNLVGPLGDDRYEVFVAFLAPTMHDAMLRARLALDAGFPADAVTEIREHDDERGHRLAEIIRANRARRL